MKRKTKRDVQWKSEARREREAREARPTKFPVPQHSLGFVLPPPIEQERNRLINDLRQRSVQAGKGQKALDDVLKKGDAIYLWHSLSNGTAALPGVHKDDRDDVTRETLERTGDDIMRVRGVLDDVSAFYATLRKARKLADRLGQELSAIFEQARVGERGGHYWIVSELLHRHHPLSEVQATMGAQFFRVKPQTYFEGVVQARKLLDRARLTAKAKAVIAEWADRWPLTEREYNQLIGPNGPRGRRSVYPSLRSD